MRAIFALFIGCALLTGCKHGKSGDAAALPQETGTRQKKTSARETKPQVTPINESAGKIASVNPNLRFVVIDFEMSRLPQVDQKLGVYRQGQKVGEVKISGQARNSIVAADVTAGEANVGDEVRPD